MSQSLPPLENRRSLPYDPIAYRLAQSLRGADTKLDEMASLVDEAAQFIRHGATGGAKDVLLRMSRALNGAISAVVYAQALEFVGNHPHIKIDRDATQDHQAPQERVR